MLMPLTHFFTVGRSEGRCDGVGGRRVGLNFLGGSRIFVLWGHTGGSQPEHGTQPQRFGSTVAKAVVAPSSVS